MILQRIYDRNTYLTDQTDLTRIFSSVSNAIFIQKWNKLEQQKSVPYPFNPCLSAFQSYILCIVKQRIYDRNTDLTDQTDLIRIFSSVSNAIFIQKWNKIEQQKSVPYPFNPCLSAFQSYILCILHQIFAATLNKASRTTICFPS